MTVSPHDEDCGESEQIAMRSICLNRSVQAEELRAQALIKESTDTDQSFHLLHRSCMDAIAWHQMKRLQYLKNN